MYLLIFNRQNYILFKISASDLFLKFCKFQPRYSYKIYSYKKKSVMYFSDYFSRGCEKKKLSLENKHRREGGQSVVFIIIT